MPDNILISSIGKRVELLREFQIELKRRCPEGKVFGVDMNPAMSPACHLADDSFKICRVTDKDYAERLLEICKANGVRLVIPTIDTELLVLSQHREEFLQNGIQIMISDPEFISICRDKRNSDEYFRAHRIKVPDPIDPHHPIFPIFAKPYDGSLSTNIHVIDSAEKLTENLLSDPKLMFMELIDKRLYREYSIDLYYGDSGEIKCIVPRERIEIRAGEINKGATRKNGLVDIIKNRMESLKGVRGVLCLQVFYREEEDDVIGIEINPRFGGGFPLSYGAGANYPAMLIEEYIFGKQHDYTDSWRDNTIMLRYDSQVIFQEYEYSKKS